MKITLAQQSNLENIDYDNLPFGVNFTDHMLVCHFENGAWQEPEIRPFGNLNATFALHALHYGQAAFEGMKAYRNQEGEVALFRPERNWERLNKSAERLLMPQVPHEVFIDGLKKLIEIDQAWVPQDEVKSLYIRPYLFSSSEFIAARPSERYTFAIICSPVGPYYAGAVKVKIEDVFTRAASGGIGFTKAAGNYGGAFYPTAKAIEEGYNQVIWTDHANHELIEESGTMNIMLRIGDKMITPPLTDRILAGITRDSIVTLLREWGHDVEERPIKVAEVVEAARNGELKEAFGMGTAAVVSVIQQIGFKGERFDIPTPEDGIASKIRKGLNDIRLGRVEDTHNWMVKVK
ncbi:branched-chain amino acid aminotransferase [Phaeocystidibacter luteus]|uniref:branched-chain-amino-acid transaminase n=1 Tax=Phaeocystidibacter luteus TaxID=911197 RepID=A0A6N6RMJ2_9FLAO|nr:branched-chain amino acid aminotransferase [Phaeocystidibacter luteus]KAB2814786.1 branched-chain amino acid aminotransferase [Phaeocystidibacter luteus]